MIILGAIAIIATIIRLFQLDTIPSEPWGDVITHYQLARAIVSGQFFLDFKFGGDGPIFSYITALVFSVSHPSFYTLKFITAIMGVAVVIATYFFSYELFKKKSIAYIAAFLTATSFWSITFSRQAKPHILVPLFVALVLLYILKKKNSVAGLLLGIGMYTQAGFWAMPLVVLFLRKFKTLLIGSLLLIPLVSTLLFRPTQYVSSNSFFGEKLGMGKGIQIGDILFKLAKNTLENMGALFVKGDVVFRHNIPNHAHLDFVSAIFFLIGFFMLIKVSLKGGDKQFLKFLIMPFFIIQIPSILDIANELSVPSMGRMIGIIPLLYTIIAYGIYTVANYIKWQSVRYFILIVFLTVIATYNLYNYFSVYPKTLPNGNTSFSSSMLRETEKYPQIKKIIVYGCCWAEWGQPEYNSLALLPKRNLDVVNYSIGDRALTDICGDIRKKKNSIAFIDPKTDENILRLSCLRGNDVYKLVKNEWFIAWVVR